jgi:quercetin dioxygenase-like cupin family protein
MRSVAPDGGDDYWFGQARMSIKARASVSGTTIIEMVLPAGATAPLHIHEHLDDTFVILDGQLAVWCDGETLTLHPGAYAQLPRGVPHSILADGGPVRALLVHDSDEMADFIEAIGTPLSGHTDPPPLSADEVALAAREHGQRVIGPAPFAIL